MENYLKTLLRKKPVLDRELQAYIDGMPYSEEAIKQYYIAMKLTIKIHSFYFSDGTYIKWFPVNNDGKAKGLFNVVIEYPSTEKGSDTIKLQKHGPATAHASKHLLTWTNKDRKNKT